MEIKSLPFFFLRGERLAWFVFVRQCVGGRDTES